MNGAELQARIAELESQLNVANVLLNDIQKFATTRRYPEDEQRTLINIHPHVKDELYVWLMEQAPSGEGYSEFIAKALAWRKYMKDA
jgi:hypothetical protein